jgi:uncharacterized protein (DUF736 family)
MPEYDNHNRGVLFKNFDKQEGSKQPDFTGKITVGGIVFELAAWEATSKRGTPYLNLKAKPFVERTPAPHPRSPVGDDIPF